MKIHILSIGKCKNQSIKELSDQLARRIRKFDLIFYELKAHGDQIKKEQDEIDQKIKELHFTGKIFLMTEWGHSYSTMEFKNQIENSYQSGQSLLFILGGASGFDKDFRQRFKNQFSLSKMTFPHETARYLLIEQIYRSQAIMDNHPYHK